MNIFRLYASVAVFTYMIMSISQGWLEACWLNVHHCYVQVMMSPPLLTCSLIQLMLYTSIA